MRNPVDGSRVKVSSLFWPTISRDLVVHNSQGMYRNRLPSYIATHIVMRASLTSNSGVRVMPTSRSSTMVLLVSISIALSFRGASPSEPSAALFISAVAMPQLSHQSILIGGMRLSFSPANGLRSWSVSMVASACCGV